MNRCLKQYRNLVFFPDNSPKHWLPTAQYHQTLTFIFSIKSSNFTAPPISRGSDASCRSLLLMIFDTSKQLWLNVAGLMSIHFPSLIGIELEDKFTTSFGLGLAFATGLPVLMNSWTFSMGISSGVSVTYLLIPFTMQTHEPVRSLNNASIVMSMQ